MVAFALIALVSAGLRAAAEPLEIPWGTAPRIDGIFGPAEWEGSATVQMEAGHGTIEVHVHLVHDGQQLYLAFEYVENPHDELIFPEILISPSGVRTDEWADVDWWFHVSATNCDAQGTYDDYSRCAYMRPLWLGRPNYPTRGYQAVHATEIRIPFSMVGIEPGRPFGLALSVDCYPSETRGYWPDGASVSSPATWGEAVLEPCATAAAVAPRQIAYCRQPMDGRGAHQIYLINIDGTADRRLIDAEIGLNHHSWSPDGRQLAAVGYVDESTWSIYRFSAEGTDLTRLTTTEDVWDTEPAWSPDGRMISFTRAYPDEDDREELWLMNADGSEQRWIGRTGFAAQWSCDGTRLVYSAVRDGRCDLYTCAFDGSDELRLTDTTGDEAFPCWSPDGGRVAFARRVDERYDSWEIFVINADGTGERQLTSNRSYDSYPRWSADGAMLSFESDRSGPQRWEIYTMNADGSHVMRITWMPGTFTAINGAWRP